MFKWNIRNQILSSGIISFLVLVFVIAYFYSFTRGEFEKNSENLISLTTGQHAAKIQRLFETRAETFQRWSADDIFGISIEFNTTSELGDEFGRWLDKAPGFALLILADKDGKVIEAATSKGLSISAASLEGSRLADFSTLKAGHKADVQLIHSKVLAVAGASDPQTYVFYRPAFSSSGDLLGGFIGYLDWSDVSSMVQSCSDALTEFGFDQTTAILAHEGNAVAVSNRLGTDNAQKSYAWTQNFDQDGVTVTEINGEASFVGTNLVSPPSLAEAGTQGGRNMALVAVVPENNVMARLNSEVSKVLIVGLIGTLLVLAVSYFIARKISRRVAHLAEVATTMATGDISHTVDIHAGDETGALASAFRRLTAYLKDLSAAAEQIADGNLTVTVEPKSDQDMLGKSFGAMLTNLTGMVTRLNESAKQLTGAAGRIASNSQHMSKGAQEQSEQMGQVSTAIEEMTATILETSKNAGDATDAARKASETATEGGQVVSDTVNGMQKISDVVRQSAESISKLAKSADQIGEIAAVIDDIADQTNLLALNAAIEAARAGEQGRGFAVVADEVRKLAERTGKATGEITQMIKGIQAETEDAVQSMEAGIQEVDKGRELADRAGSSLTAIVAMNERVMDMIRQIATASEEQSTAAEEISKNIEHVSTVTSDTANGAEQSASAAGELNVQAEELETMVARFKIKT